MEINYSKYNDGLVPAIVQDYQTNKVLMLGFMNKEALAATEQTKKVTFFSRSKDRLWTKGETSGNHLLLRDILVDCDRDSLLIKAEPVGPVCHTATDTCFNEVNPAFSISILESIISARKNDPSENSYTSQLFAGGVNKIAQKVGEEAVELVIESKDNDNARFLSEAADLLFHYLVLLQHRNFKMEDVIEVLAGKQGK